MTPREILDSVIADHGASWSPADRDLAARIVSRASRFASDIAILDVPGQAELAQLKAQLANVAAAEAQNVENIAVQKFEIIKETIERVLKGAAEVAVKGLGLVT